MLKIPQLEARTSAPAGVDTDLLVVFQDGSRKAIAPKGPHGKLVERLRKAEAFQGRASQLQFVRFGGRGKIANSLFVGLGTPADLTTEKARLAGGHAYAKLRAEKCAGAVVHVAAFAAKGVKADVTDPRLLRAFAEGLVLSAYAYDRHRAKPESADKYQGPGKIAFVSTDKNLVAALTKELAHAQAAAVAANVCRDWSNEPSNFGTPEYFADQARALAKEHGLKCTILTEKDALKEKMGLFIGVGQGAERESRIVIVEYEPAARKDGAPVSDAERTRMKTIAYVGKGVTFDSGGISIKPGMRMEEMKHDMTGAATVMGATILAAKWKVPHRIVTIMGFVENMPDGDAIQPGNVLTSRAGKTVEIINTDAEGRLVLGDLLDYIQDYGGRKPDAIVDVATLTGAVAIALGKQCCAILGNDDALIEGIRRAGDVNGERIWQLPLFDEYFDDLRSEWADMRNSANDSYGGTIRGAIFLKQFIRKGMKWAHLDIAATGANVSHLSYFPKKGATGAYVRTLAQFAADFS